MPFKKRPELHRKEVLKEVFKLRSDGCGYPAIRDSLQQKFNISVSVPTVKSLYLSYLARIKAAKALQKQTETTLEPEADINKMIMTRFEKLTAITNKIVEMIENITSRKDLPEGMLLKYLPSILALSRETLSQLAFLRSQQEKIQLNQQNLIYSPLQIMTQVNQILATKEKDGLIILKDKKTGLIQTSEEKKEEEKCQVEYTKEPKKQEED